MALSLEQDIQKVAEAGLITHDFHRGNAYGGMVTRSAGEERRGREAELASLEALFLATVDESSARLVLLTSPAGNGKSRLRQELIERLRRAGHPFELLSGAAEVTSAGAPLQILAHALRRTAGLHDGDPIELQQKLLRERVVVADDGPALADRSPAPPRRARASRP